MADCNVNYSGHQDVIDDPMNCDDCDELMQSSSTETIRSPFCSSNTDRGVIGLERRYSETNIMERRGLVFGDLTSNARSGDNFPEVVNENFDESWRCFKYTDSSSDSDDGEIEIKYKREFGCYSTDNWLDLHKISHLNIFNGCKMHTFSSVGLPEIVIRTALQFQIDECKKTREKEKDLEYPTKRRCRRSSSCYKDRMSNLISHSSFHRYNWLDNRLLCDTSSVVGKNTINCLTGAHKSANKCVNLQVVTSQSDFVEPTQCYEISTTSKLEHSLPGKGAK